MSTYKALARQWRPQSFQYFVGQEHAIKALQQSLKRQDVHHAHLLTGTRGVGKTSLARVLAKGLSCLEGITDTPCEKCSHCEAIEQGNYIDLIEIDAASKTKVEDTKELLSQVNYPPVQGRFKIYLIDEVHSLSTNSFNALLKTLEEPPEHIKFILATTDPQKLPITIQSRCLQLHLQHLHHEQIAEQLATILKSLNKKFDHQAILAIAKSATGSMRDALSLLEQMIAMSGDEIESEAVYRVLGSAPTADITNLLLAIIRNETLTIDQILNKLENNSNNYLTIIDQMLTCLYEATRLHAMGNHKQTGSQIHELSETIKPEQTQLYIQMLIKTKSELGLYPSHTMGYNLMIMRMMTFILDETHVNDLFQIKDLNTTDSKASSEMPTIKQHEPKERPTRSVSAILKENTSHKKSLKQNIPESDETDKAKDLTNKNQNEGNNQTKEPIESTKQENDWQTILHATQCKGLIKQILSGSTLISNEKADTWIIKVDSSLNNLANPNFEQKISSMCQEVLKRPIHVQLQKQETQNSTPIDPVHTNTQINKDDKKPASDSHKQKLDSQEYKNFVKDLKAEPLKGGN